jgi:hypothetical protein
MLQNVLQKEHAASALETADFQAVYVGLPREVAK